MSTIQTNIAQDRECDHCGYNLKGLPMGGKCPECGSSVRKLSSKTTGTISDEAPTRFVKLLRMGFLLASCAIILRIIGAFWAAEISAGIGLLSALLWIVGIYFITLQRPNRENIRKDRVLDNDRFRLIVRVVNIAWPADAILTVVLVSLMNSTNGVSNVLLGLLAALAILISITAWVGMIPTSVYIAELAYWSSNNVIADRLRGAAWVLAVVGTIVALLTGLDAVSGNRAFGFIAFFPSVIIFLAIIVYNYSVIQMTNVMHWVIKNQVHAAGSFNRIEERRKKEEQYKGRIVDDTPCDFCGYNLIGLEPGNQCPECGTLISHPTIPAINDPAKSNYHDTSPLHIDSNGENQGVYFNDQLDAYGKPKEAGVPYQPDIEVPDDGDIPLSLDEEEPKPITHENKDFDAPGGESGIKPISFDDER
jgi:predicted Zn-ribbon and HTH transcriptional regulator